MDTFPAALAAAEPGEREEEETLSLFALRERGRARGKEREERSMISFDSVQWRARALFPHYRASISSIVIVVYGPNRVRDITENVRGAGLKV